jgi:hypothetical protein
MKYFMLAVVAAVGVSNIVYAQGCPQGAYYCRPAPVTLTGNEVMLIRQSSADKSTPIANVVGAAVGGNGTPFISVLPVGAGFSNVYSTQSITNFVNASGSKAPWMVNLGDYVENNNTAGNTNVELYMGIGQGINAAPTWAGNENICRGCSVTTQGNGGNFVGTALVPVASSTFGWEHDFSNFDQDAVDSVGPFTVSQYIHNQSYFVSSDAIYLDSAPLQNSANGNTNHYAWLDGLSMYGAWLNKENDILLYTNAQVALEIEGVHTTGIDMHNDTGISKALLLAHNQQICMDGLERCMYFDSVSDNTNFTNDTGSIVSLFDNNGNWIFSGSLTAATGLAITSIAMSDPHVVGKVWDNGGVLMRSHG